MSRHEGKARLPWSVKGVSGEARELAKSATSREGETMGGWLSDVIRRVGAAQAAGRPLSLPHRRSVPALPGRRATAEPRTGAGVQVVTGGRSAAEPVPAAGAQGASETVDEAALVALVAERIERTETRLAGLLGSLEDIANRLTDRLDRLERELDDDGGQAFPEDDPRSLPRP